MDDVCCAGFFDTNRESQLRVVKLSKLTHSNLAEIPNDFICDDRKSLVCACSWTKDMHGLCASACECLFVYFSVSELDGNTWRLLLYLNTLQHYKMKWTSQQACIPAWMIRRILKSTIWVATAKILIHLKLFALALRSRKCRTHWDPAKTFRFTHVRNCKGL